MAEVNLISIQIADSGGLTGNVLVPVPTGLTIAEIQTYVDAMLPNLDVVTGGKINKASVSLALTLPAGLKANAIAGTPIQWGGNFAFDAANTPYRFTVHVPAIDQGLVTGEDIDTSGVAAAWVTDMVSGDLAVNPSDRYGNDLVSLLDARVSFRK